MIIKNLLAKIPVAAPGGDPNGERIFGTITPPSFISENPSGLITLFNNILKILIVVAGIFALLNFILAGYAFMSAGGDPKKIDAAWGKIWQSMVGLLLIAVSFALAALLGKLLFGSATAILQPTIYGPGN
jgi:hypothetical protein